MSSLARLLELPAAWLAPPLARAATQALLVLHLIAAVALGVFAWKHPLANWDIIPYAALVHAQPGMSSQDVSRLAYADVRAYVGNDRFLPMVQGGDEDAAYRAALFRDPQALKDNLRFYSVKPLYIALSKGAHVLTGNAASAAVLVSAAAFTLVLAIFPLFFHRRALAIVALWLLVLVGTPPLWLIATCATPDTLGLLFVVACAMTAFRRGPWWAVAALGLLAVLSRPDAAFLLCPLLFGFAWLQRGEGRMWPLLACTAAVFCLFVFLGLQGLPWHTLFRHTFFGRQAFPLAAALAVPVTPEEYLSVIRRTLPNVLEARPIVIMTAGLLLAAVPLVLRQRIAGFQWLAASAVAGMVVHYLLFPIDEFGHERMFLGGYFLVLAALLIAAGPAENRAAR